MNAQDTRIVLTPSATRYQPGAWPSSARTAARLARAAAVASTSSATAPSSLIAARWRIVAVDACAATRAVRADGCVRRDAVAQHQISPHANTPADKNARRHAPGQRQQRQHY